MEGLEVSILPLSEVSKDNSKIRIDSGYFTKAALTAEALVEALPNDPLGELSDTFRKGIFDIKADTYVEPGEGVPFIRITDIKTGIIQKHSTAWIDHAAHSSEAKTALKFGDLVLSKTAYPAAAIVNVPDCNVSQDTIAVRLSTDGKRQYRTGYIAAYLNSAQGLALMARRFQGNVQQHLSLEDGKSIRIPRLSTPFQDRVHELVLRVDRQQVAVTNAMSAAEDALLTALGLANWTPPEPLAYTARASDVFASGRFDAQYFRPLFAEVADRLQATGGAIELGTILSVNARGRQPQYSETGLPVINSKHVRKHRVILEDNRSATESGSPVVIETGDVLLNGTGVGTIGRAAPYLHQTRALPDNHVTVLRTDSVDPVYLSVFLNSPLGQWQIERHIKGSSGQIELYPTDIAQIMIWDAPDSVQRSVRAAILSAFDEERRANDFLDAAKRAVEIAIEDGEPAAMAYLDQAEGAI